MRRFKTENDILEVVKNFENGTIRREDWKHAEHLTVALYYLSNQDYETAYHKMRNGIFNLLKAFEVDLTKEMPYHETLTVFWLKTVDGFRKSKTDCSISEMCNELTEKFDKNYPLKFYSRDFLFSKKARIKFHDPDLKLIDDFNSI